MMNDFDSLKRVVVETLSRQLSRVKIIGVDIAEDTGPDNEDVLRIDVILEGNPSDIDPRTLSGLIRNLRPVLIEAKESAFPLISLISKADLPRERRAS